MAHGVTSEGTALALHRLLEAEGVVLHAALQARALPAMGGGMGIVLKEPLAAGTTLARFPFHSMITARKARFNLAMAEVALELHAGGDAATCADALRVVPFTARVWSGYEYESRIRSQRVRHAIDAKVEALAAALDSTETVVCYVLLMAALHGRWSGAPTRSADGHREDEEEEKAAPVSSGQRAPVLRFTHENAWMRTWVHTLPAQYDNLLELAPQDHDSTAATRPTSSLPPPPPLMRATAAYATTPAWLRSYVGLDRFRSAVAKEQRTIEQRHATCCAALRCLQCLPTGVEEEQEEGEPADTGAEETALGASGTPIPSLAKAQATPQQGGPAGSDAPPCEGRACTLGQFLWAFNTLMSRGFFFPEETWAMMPFVDYFNYALDSNATMYPEEDDPDDEQGFTNALLRSRGGGGGGAAAHPTHAPRKPPRRTGLRSVRVGDPAAVPLANYQTYEFQLVQPTRATDEQVLLHYGAYSDVELLLWYGFTLRPSLLPTSHVPPCTEDADAGAALVSHGLAPLLPPCLDDSDGDASTTALALRRLLPRVAQAKTRVALFNACVAPSLPTDDADALEGAYNTWCTALGRAYRLPLSPLADAEGNYPAAACGSTWLDELLRAFAQTPAPVPPTGDASDDDAAACRVDAWMRRWAAERWPAFSATAFPRLNSDCALGVLGLSPGLHAALHTSFWAPSPGRLALSPQERVRLVRGLAWAELHVNATLPSATAAATPSTVCPPASAAAAAFARTVSVDQWALLRFLALECAEAALEEYVAYVSDR